MNKLGVHHGQHNGISKPPVHHHGQHNGISKPPVHHHGKGGGGGGKGKQGGGGGGGKGIKVVYISSPMKLTASAEEFRAVVQELTGRDSNVAEHDVEGGAVASSSYPSYSSFGRASPTTPAAAATTAAAAARALPPAMEDQYAAGASAMPPPFQSIYDQTGGASLLDGQDFYW